MILNSDRIRTVTFGCARIAEENGKIVFNRFTNEQSECYRQFRSFDFYRKTFASAGVRMAFKTDSRTLAFGYVLSYGSSRPFGWFDMYVNGIITERFGGEGMLPFSGHAQASLPEGEKLVELYFPWSKATAITDFTLDDGSSLEPAGRAKSLICFGDSITQGYDAQFPSFTYASQLAGMLGAELRDLAIGGDTFFPELLYARDEADPDIITVAYGTNDWNTHNRERLMVSGYAFIEKLTQKFPRAAIFVITPIWRADGNRETPFGAPHSAVDEEIRSFCAELPGVTVINGMPLAPHCPDFYSDHYLHPNDTGFCVYAKNLYAEISKYLPIPE